MIDPIGVPFLILGEPTYEDTPSLYLSIEEQCPNVSYSVSNKLVVSVIDERDCLSKGKPDTFVGQQFDAFNLPTDMLVQSWSMPSEDKVEQSVAAAVEERLVLGLEASEWKVEPAGWSARPTAREVIMRLETSSAENLLLLSLNRWYVRLDPADFTMSFSWRYTLEIYNAKGESIAAFSDAGTGVVDKTRLRSGRQHMLRTYREYILLAYRDRLTQILERVDIKAVLRETPFEPTMVGTR